MGKFNLNVKEQLVTLGKERMVIFTFGMILAVAKLCVNQFTRTKGAIIVVMVYLFIPVQVLANLEKVLSITVPVEGATVEQTEVIYGKTSFPEMNHYIVVTPLKTGDRWIQDEPVTINVNGTWTGLAKFGESTVGAGENFRVQGIAIKSTLSPGQLTSVPPDAIFSGPIKVTRKTVNDTSPPNKVVEFVLNNWEKLGVFVFGVVFAITFLIFAIVIPRPTPFAYTVFRIILALSAAGVAATIPGLIVVELSFGIRAGGAMAVFVIVFFFNPARLVVDDTQTTEVKEN